MLKRPQESTITKDSSNLRSYSQVVKGQHEGQPHQNIDLQNFELPESSSAQLEGLQLKTPSMSQGKPALHFTVSEKSHLLGKLKYVLVGKFSHGRPTWASVKSFFSGLKLNGPHNISVFDNKHIYIKCSNKGDFNRIWLRLYWSIDGHVMRIFKWGPHFNPLIENPIAPVWLRMEGLPLYMFDEMALMNLANVIGSPIKIDARNLNRSKLNSASVCVELDVTKPLVDSVKVVFVEDKSGVHVDEFSVQVFYDYVPPYCSSCLHIGHFHTKCKRIKVDILEDEAHSQRQGKEQVAQTVSILEAGEAAAQHKRVWKPVTLEISGPEQAVNAEKLSSIDSDQQIEKTLLLQNQFQTLPMDGADLALMNEKLVVTDLVEIREATELKELPADSSFDHMAAVISSLIESNEGVAQMAHTLLENNIKQTECNNQKGQQHKNIELDTFDAQNTQCAKAWKPTEDKEEVMMAEQVALRELQPVVKVKEVQLLDVSRQEDTAETSTNTETQLSNIDNSLALNSQAVNYNEKQLGLEPHQNENSKEEQQIAGSFCKDTTAGKANIETNPEDCSSKAIVAWEGADNLEGIAAAEQPSTQEWQVVGKKNNKTKGVVTRSQTKNANCSWANTVENEQVEQSPIATKAQAGNNASQDYKSPTKSRYQLERKIDKLFSRLSNMNMRDGIRRQLRAELAALRAEQEALKDFPTSVREG